MIIQILILIFHYSSFHPQILPRKATASQLSSTFNLTSVMLNSILQNVTLHMHVLMCSCISAVQVNIHLFVFTAVHYIAYLNYLKCLQYSLSSHN